MSLSFRDLPKFSDAWWWMRGVLVVMTVLVLVPAVTPIERYAILRGVHAVIINWTELTGWLGAMIGRLPFVPELH